MFTQKAVPDKFDLLSLDLLHEAHRCSSMFERSMARRTPNNETIEELKRCCQQEVDTDTEAVLAALGQTHTISIA